jgi:hypothetical protein
MVVGAAFEAHLCRAVLLILFVGSTKDHHYSCPLPPPPLLKVVWSIIVVLRGVTSSGPSGVRLGSCADSVWLRRALCWTNVTVFRAVRSSGGEIVVGNNIKSVWKLKYTL